MKPAKTILAILMSSIPVLSGKDSATAAPQTDAGESSDPIDPIALRPLNEPQDNLFAGHRSHSSHSSHRSSSGGGYSAPQREPTPTPRTPSESPSDRSLTAPQSRPTDPGRAAPVSPKPKPATPAPLTTAEKKTLQVMRVQIALISLGLYTGPVDGVLSGQTQEALKRYQIVKGIEPNGLMSTETLNALGVPAVQ